MRKILLTGFLLLWTLFVFAASKYWVGGGTNTNWNSSPVTNWANTSGGAGNQTAPGSGDDVFFDGVGATANGASVVSANITVLSLTFSSGYTNTVTINTAVTLTIGGNFTDNTAHSWTVSGTGALAINNTATIASGGKTFPGPVTLSGAVTHTLSADWTITGTVSLPTGGHVLNGNILNVGGGLTVSGSQGSGTTKIVMNGTGTLSGGTLVNDLDINTAGTITIGANIFFNTKTLKWVAGTIAGTGTLTISGTSTLDLGGQTLPNISFNSGGTITLNSSFVVSNTLTIGTTATTFAGTAGWTTATLTVTSTSGVTHTFVNGLTYTITTAFNAYNGGITGTSSTGANLTFTSNHATLKALLTLNPGATCSVIANFTRIDASGGRTINTFHGTLTSTTNIVSYTDYNGGTSSSCLFVQ